MRKLNILIAMLAFGLVFVGCDNGTNGTTDTVTQKDYYGSWVAYGSYPNWAQTVVISENKLVFAIAINYEPIYQGHGTVENLVWEPVSNRGAYVNEYPEGFAISGTVTSATGNYNNLQNPDAQGNIVPVTVGQTVTYYFYLHTDKRSMAQGHLLTGEVRGIDFPYR